MCHAEPPVFNLYLEETTLEVTSEIFLLLLFESHVGAPLNTNFQLQKAILTFFIFRRQSLLTCLLHITSDTNVYYDHGHNDHNGLFLAGTESFSL